MLTKIQYCIERLECHLFAGKRIVLSYSLSLAAATLSYNMLTGEAKKGVCALFEDIFYKLCKSQRQIMIIYPGSILSVKLVREVLKSTTKQL